MNYITHGIGGLGAGLATASLIGVNDVSEATIIAGAVLGSLIIDIDHTKSFIGRKAPVASHLASAVFKHRGFLHTPLFIVLASMIISAGILFLDGPEQSWARQFAAGLIPGMLSHIILDTFNKGGISWLWPITKKRYRLLSIKTDSITESAFTLCLGCIVGYFFIH